MTNDSLARLRLDYVLVSRGLIKTRSQALLSIKERNVTVNGLVCTKPNKQILKTDVLALVRPPLFVSRGGDKLAAALQAFKLTNLTGKKALDIGASTGGFSDCLLQAGVMKIYAVDVGTAQLDPLLRSEGRIVVMEKTDIRSLKVLPERVDIIVIDVSFISLTHIIPLLGHFITANGQVVALVKPQFEVGRGKVNRQGLVIDPGLYKQVLDTVGDCFKHSGFDVTGYIQSPLLGGTGNTEFLMHVSKS